MNPIDRLLSVISPYVCVRCGREGAVVCTDCVVHVIDLPSVCYACGRAVRNFVPCPKCVSASSPRHAWIAAEYSGITTDIVHAYKFDFARGAAREMAAMMDDVLPYFARAPIVTFVPTASSHRRQRGFDHAELLARELARGRRWQFGGVLNRLSQTTQKGADRLTRKAQLDDAFSVSAPWLVKGEHVLLVDDVLTTGATIEQVTKLLKKAGASEVDAVVFARTPETK